MSWLTLAVAALLGTPTPLIINSPTTTAGQPEIFVVTRTANTAIGTYVLIKTADGTAHAGTDYTPNNHLYYLRPNQTSVIFTVQTQVNPGGTGTLDFSIVAAASNLTARGIGHIVEQTVIPVGYIAAPIQKGGLAVVTGTDNWQITGPGPSRLLNKGEIVSLYTGPFLNYDGEYTWAVHSNNEDGRMWQKNLQGIIPKG